MSTFNISAASNQADLIPVSVAKGIEVDEESLFGFKAFKDWFENLMNNLAKQHDLDETANPDPWILRGIKVHSVTKFNTGKIGFMNIEAILRKDPMIKRDGDVPTQLDRVVFLRGGSVAVLMILRPKEAKHERYVIMTEQPRVGACGMRFLEIPAGMMDDEDEVTGAAIKEIKEETGFQIHREELIDMTALALGQARNQESLHNAMYPSPANLDEFISLLLWEKELDRKEIEALKGKLTGLRSQDEVITLRLRDYEVLWKEGARDAKTLGAWALYEGLNRSGQIEEKLHEIRIGQFEKSRAS